MAHKKKPEPKRPTPRGKKAKGAPYIGPEPRADRFDYRERWEPDK